MIAPTLARLGNFSRGLLLDTSGVILPYVTIILAVIVGTSVLALDGGRAMSLQSQLQKGADALALAGAAELDRLPNSTTRAVAAINNLVTNSSVFGTGGAANVTVSAINFRTTLPADNAALTAPFCSGLACTAEQSVMVRFVEVTVTPTTIPTILPAFSASWFGGGTSNSVTAGAAAVAGMNQAVCKFTPMFICNPFESADGSMSYGQATEALFNGVADPAVRRRLIQMRQGGGGGSYSPGNYGFLVAASIGNGAAALSQAIAMANPPACLGANGVETETGFIASVRAAFNVRFDIYEGSMNSVKDDPNYRPARNVRKGFSYTGANACNATYNPDTVRFRELPQDNCFNTDSCPYMGGRMGDGNWDFDGYWTVNHTLVGGGLQAKPTVNGAPASNTNLPSRYDVYRYEIDQGASFITNLSGRGATPPPSNGETGAPMCSSAAPNDNPDRRIFYSAIVNCKASLPPALPLSGGNNTGVPVAAFGKFFITEPVKVAQDEIRAELLELVTPGNSNGVNFDQVQLYR